MALVSLGIIAGITYYLSGLEAAAPTVDRRSLLMGTVERGEMLREARGVGTLVPEQETWITAVVNGRVKAKLVEAGIEVHEDTELLELSSPDLDLAALNAKWQFKSSEAQLAALKVSFESQVLAMESTVADLESNHTVASLRVDANEQLVVYGLLSDLDMKLSRAELEAAAKRLEAEGKRLAKYRESRAAELAVQEAQVEQARALHELRLSELDSLRVRAGVEGVLELFTEAVGVGKQVAAGTVLAKVSNPEELKAELRIPESQARDAQIGLPVELEILNQKLPGRVNRIDPAVVEGSVVVDVEILVPLPRGARPDLSVIGTIEIERLEDVLHVDRPVFASEDGATTLFKLVEGGTYAVRMPVRFGRSSVNLIEVLEGLEVGDEVILSDMNRWDHVERIRIKQ